MSSSIPALDTDLKHANLLASGLCSLADRVEGGAEPNPTALLCIRNAKLSETLRLRYRAEWIRQLAERRRESGDSHQLYLLDTAYVLHVARLDGLKGAYLVRNQDLALRLMRQVIHLQPGLQRLSHYCRRRTGPDPELIAVSYFAEALCGRIDGTADYLAAMYCMCRQPDLRFRLVPAAAPGLRQLAADWLNAATRIVNPQVPGGTDT